jgi:TonB-dependent SusC/RagA subfamily outer membrane receptor
MSASLFRVTRILACAPALLALDACYPAPATVDGPSPAQQLSNALVPRPFPGVDVVSTRHGGFVVQIHSGLVGAGAPLYLIDGAPVQVQPSRGIDWVKLEDVVQIRVLKDPVETMVYGPRGANGVIVITTRQALRGRTPRR